MGKNLLRESFSDKKTEDYQKLYEKLYVEAMEDRKNVKLVPDKIYPGLYMRVDKGLVTGFEGDCCFCSKHTPEVGFAEGFFCKKHGWGCGYGFTCPDNDYEGNAGWAEFERIKGGKHERTDI